MKNIILKTPGLFQSRKLSVNFKHSVGPHGGNTEFLLAKVQHGLGIENGGNDKGQANSNF
jgi:hypothetical protein